MRETRCAKFAQCVKGYSHATCINIALTPEKQLRYRRVSLTLKISQECEISLTTGKYYPQKCTARKYIYRNLQVNCVVNVAVILVPTGWSKQGICQHNYDEPQNRRVFQGKKPLKAAPMLVFYVLIGPLSPALSHEGREG